MEGQLSMHRMQVRQVKREVDLALRLVRLIEPLMVEDGDKDKIQADLQKEASRMLPFQPSQLHSSASPEEHSSAGQHLLAGWDYVTFLPIMTPPCACLSLAWCCSASKCTALPPGCPAGRTLVWR